MQNVNVMLMQLVHQDCYFVGVVTMKMQLEWYIVAGTCKCLINWYREGNVFAHAILLHSYKDTMRQSSLVREDGKPHG